MATKLLLKRVYKEGFNIYSLINRVKKERGWEKGRNFPSEVIDGVCYQYLKDKKRITEPYPWFKKVLNIECSKWYADQNAKRGEEFKKEEMPMAIKELIRSMGK